MALEQAVGCCHGGRGFATSSVTSHMLPTGGGAGRPPTPMALSAPAVGNKLPFSAWSRGLGANTSETTFSFLNTLAAGPAGRGRDKAGKGTGMEGKEEGLFVPHTLPGAGALVSCPRLCGGQGEGGSPRITASTQSSLLGATWVLGTER